MQCLGRPKHLYLPDLTPHSGKCHVCKQDNASFHCAGCKNLFHPLCDKPDPRWTLTRNPHCSLCKLCENTYATSFALARYSQGDDGWAGKARNLTCANLTDDLKHYPDAALPPHTETRTRPTGSLPPGPLPNGITTLGSAQSRVQQVILDWCSVHHLPQREQTSSDIRNAIAQLKLLNKAKPSQKIGFLKASDLESICPARTSEDPNGRKNTTAITTNTVTNAVTDILQCLADQTWDTLSNSIPTWINPPTWTWFRLQAPGTMSCGRLALDAIIRAVLPGKPIPAGLAGWIPENASYQNLNSALFRISNGKLRIETDYHEQPNNPPNGTTPQAHLINTGNHWVSMIHDRDAGHILVDPIRGIQSFRPGNNNSIEDRHIATQRACHYRSAIRQRIAAGHKEYGIFKIMATAPGETDHWGCNIPHLEA